jgi:hypothetical protein
MPEYTHAVVEIEDFMVRSVHLYEGAAAAGVGYYRLWMDALLADGYPPDLVDDTGVIDAVVSEDYDSAEMRQFHIAEETPDAE